MTRTLPTLCAALAVLLAGCANFGTLECTSSGDANFAGKTLRVLSHGAWGNYEVVKPLFENQTGARLEEIEANDAGSALRLAIQNRGAPVADVLYGVDNLLIREALEEGIFEPYESPALRDRVPEIRLEDFRRDGLLYATPVDHGFINVNYDIALAQANHTPATLRDLASPAWASKFVVENPNLSSPGLGFLLITVKHFGETGPYTFLDYWRDLFAGGVLVTDGWTEAYVYHYSGGYGKFDNTTFVGDRSLVVSYTTSPAVEVYFGAESVPGVSFEPPRSAFHQVETMGILACTRNLPLAQAFVDFSLSPAFQETVGPYMAVYPVLRGVDVPGEFHTLATDPARVPAVPFDADADGPKIAGWLTAWTDLYQTARQ